MRCGSPGSDPPLHAWSKWSCGFEAYLGGNPMPCNVFGRPSLTRLFVRSVHNRSQSRHFRVSPFGSWSRLKPQPSPRQRSPESVSPLDWMEPGIGERRLPFPASPGRPPGDHSFVDTPAALRGGSGIRAQDTTRSGSLTRKCLNLLEDRPDQRWRAGRRSSKRNAEYWIMQSVFSPAWRRREPDGTRRRFNAAAVG